jgi:hypothetical protein
VLALKGLPGCHCLWGGTYRATAGAGLAAALDGGVALGASVVAVDGGLHIDKTIR